MPVAFHDEIRSRTIIRKTVPVLATIAAVTFYQVLTSDSEGTVVSSVELAPSSESVHSTPLPVHAERIPLASTKNMGQWDDEVLFRADSGGAVVWITRDRVCYQFTRRTPEEDSLSDDPRHMPHDRFGRESDSIEQLVVNTSFAGGNPSPEIVAEEMSEYRCNYFIGNDPAKWPTDVPNYAMVMLRGISDGVDIEFYGGSAPLDTDGDGVPDC